MFHFRTFQESHFNLKQERIRNVMNSFACHRCCIFIEKNMKIYCGYFQRFYIAVLCLPLCVLSTQSQTVSLFGKVIDASTHQPIRDAVVVVLELGQRKNTNDDGQFCFEHLASGRYTISAHHIAYAGVERSVMCNEGQSDSTIIELQPALLQSDEVVVRSTRTSSATQGIPYPFNVETNDQLVQQSSVSVSDALKDSPGISLVRDGSWETDVSIRGMGRSNIVTMIDNTRIETATDIPALFHSSTFTTWRELKSSNLRVPFFTEPGHSAAFST